MARLRDGVDCPDWQQYGTLDVPRCAGAPSKRAFKARVPIVRSVTSLVHANLGLVIQDRVQERAVNLDFSVVGNKAKLSTLVHEKADAGAGCPDHLREGLLADLCRDRLRGAVLSEICQKQKKAGEPLLARIE